MKVANRFTSMTVLPVDFTRFWSPNSRRGFQAFALRLPEETYLSSLTEIIEPDRLHQSKKVVKQALAGASELILNGSIAP
ncbi:MAG: hypothetical protein CM1200mP20_16820 [Pseudomonadota bacterium]|nr:MAG: hypothetical protein CM1200mP20_16820 [Pseudomonadota bacterium]